MTFERLRLAETDANRVRKTNIVIDSLNGATAPVVAPASQTAAVQTVSTAGKTTTVTLSGQVVNMVDATTAGSQGGVKLLDFPQGAIAFIGGVANLTVTKGTGGLSATAAVVGSVGTTLVANDNATLTGTEADLVPSTASTLTAGAGVTKGFSAAITTVVFDGTATAKSVYLNFAAPDIDSTADDTLTVSGSVTLSWIYLGDV